jgi:hypothetical protein
VTLRALALAAALAMTATCGGSSDDSAAAPPPPEAPARPKITPEEARTGRDACKAYVAQVCACAAKVTTLAQECRDAPKLVDSLTLMLEVAANAEQRRDALQILANVRRTIKRCIERTAELPSQGCS